MRRLFTTPNLAMAASVAALCVAAPAAFYIYRSQPGPRPASQPLPSQQVGQDFAGLVKERERQQQAALIDRAPPQRAAEQRSATALEGKVEGNAQAGQQQPKPDADTGTRQVRTLPLSPAKPSSPEPQGATAGVPGLVVAAPPPAAPPAKVVEKVFNAPVSELRLDSAKPALRDEGQQFRFGASTKFGGDAKTEEDYGGSGGWQRPMAGFTADGRLATLAAPPPADALPRPQAEAHRDQFQTVASNPVKRVADEPVSTFSIDVDTASYSIVRRSLNAGRLPPKAAVRVEEMINYFPYDYPRPEGADAPFQPTIQVMPSPWNAANQLVHIAIKGYDLTASERPRANLVLLVDISGSMQPADRLPLLRNAFRMLLDTLRPDDTVAIVTYASGSDVRLEPTRVADRARIIAAIDSLSAGGSTAGARGIADAYRVAEANFDKAAVNRVILATDGDWNVGITNRDELKGFIERKRDTGIYLSILGVGMGNHNDALMQALAQNGNGVAAYIDTLNEARKVLVDEASSTLFPIARDVKIQLEFNPARVSEYRLVGYESRMLRREDFNNDKVDAGDVGSGHSVTAIYEITPVGSQRLADGLRYQQPDRTRREPVATASLDAEIGFLKLRYKLPKEAASRLTTFTIGEAQVKRSVAEASTEARFSVAVAAFGQLLGGSAHLSGFGYDDVIALANSAKGPDPFGYRAELVNLARLAKSARP